MKIVSLFTIFLLFCGCQANLELHLQDVAVLIGSDAVIPCDYTIDDSINPDDLLRITWSRKVNEEKNERVYLYDVATGTLKDARVVRNMSMTPDGTLQIPRVTLEDNDLYSTLFCEVDFGQVSNEVGSLKFTVVAHPTVEPDTSLSQETAFQITDEPIEVGYCESGSGYPEPVIRFFKGNEALDTNRDNLGGDTSLDPDEIDQFTNQEVHIKQTNGTFVTRRTLLRTLTAEDDNADFYCEVTSGLAPVLEVQRKAFPKFRVVHRTTWVKVTPKNREALIGELIPFKCDTNGYPEPDISFYGQSSKTLDIVVASPTQNTSVTCIASNSNQLVQDTATFEIIYSKTPVITGTSSVKFGEALSLYCSAESNPALNLNWYKDGKKYSQGEQLKIDSASFTDTGSYTCKGLSHYPTLEKTSAATEVIVTGLHMDQEKETVFGKKKQVVSLECLAMANPKPTFKWTDPKGKKVTDSVESNNGYKYLSIIKVGPLDSSLSEAQYNCTVSVDQIGTRTKTFVFPALAAQASTPVTAIVIAVILIVLVVVAVVAVLYKKGIIGNKTKNEEVEETIGMSKEDAEERGAPKDDIEAGKEKNPEPVDADAPEQEALMKKNGEKQH